jgi:viologen exporter family transport system permease protein
VAGLRFVVVEAPPPRYPPQVLRTVRALPTLLRVGLAEAVAYRAEFVVWLLSTNMPLVMMALWTAVARDAPVGRFEQRDFVAYFLAALVVRLLTGAWVIWELNYEIRQGTLAFRLLRPLHPLLAYACENVAAMPLRIALSLPIALTLLFTVGAARVTHDPVLLAIFPVTVLGAWLITFLAMSIVGALAFYVDSAGSVFELWMGLFGVFSGYLVPLDLFPGWVTAFARFLPFRYMLAFPVELLIGMQTRTRALVELGVQWSFVGLLLLGALGAWRLGLRRFAAFGG